MTTIHKIQFPLASDQTEVWNIYRQLKIQRKNKSMVEILKEISENYSDFKSSLKSEDPSYKSLLKIKKTPQKLIELLNLTKDEPLRAYLREEIKKLVDLY
jgi:hypothetical protein